MRLVPVSGPALSFTGVTTTSGSPVVTAISDTSLIQVGAIVAGSGIPSQTLISAIGTNQVTLTNNATATSSAAAITVGLEPITLAEAKLHARVEYSDDDTLIASLIVAARRYCENRQRVAYLSQSWTLILDSFPSAGGYYNRAVREIWPSMGGLPSGLGFYPGLVPNSTGVIDIPKPPLISITSVKYYDFNGVLQTVDPTTYNVSLGIPGRIQPAYSKVWPISRPTIDSVQVTFAAGMGATPADVSDAVKAAMKLLIGHWYENREGAVVGVISATLDFAVDALLAVDDPGIYA
jgi:Phage gp6-like head-tail connector protein